MIETIFHNRLLFNLTCDIDSNINVEVGSVLLDEIWSHHKIFFSKQLNSAVVLIFGTFSEY